MSFNIVSKGALDIFNDDKMNSNQCPIKLSSCTSGYIYTHSGTHYKKGINPAARIVLIYEDENDESIDEDGENSGGKLIGIPKDCDSVKD